MDPPSDTSILRLRNAISRIDYRESTGFSQSNILKPVTVMQSELLSSKYIITFAMHRDKNYIMLTYQTEKRTPQCLRIDIEFLKRYP
jgi:hypothetical protein